MRGLTLIALLVAPLVAGVDAKTKPRVSAAWYAGWHATDFPLSKVSWHKYTHLMYSFAETTPDVSNITLAGSDPSLLPQFVKTAKKNGVKAIVTIGGWTGGRWFSTDVGNAANRTAFVKTVLNFAKKHDLDGLDFDWEYPANQGIGCNNISPKDTAHLLSFLKELRGTAAGKKLYLSAAAPLFPWADANGDSTKDVSGFAKVLDHIAIMNYDVWGSWSTSVGPNGPLNDTCAAAANQDGSAVSAVAAWHAAGIPLNQLVLGVPAYGHSFSVAPADAYTKSGQLALYAPFNASVSPVGDAWDDAAGTDECGNASGPGGLWDFWGLIQAGWLTSKGTPSKGIDYVFDKCTQTPFIYNKTSEIMVSYDNVQSFAAKGAYIKNTGLLGFATWEAGGDYKDMLLDSIRGALGLK